jgi:hypothetical protein
MSKRTRQPGLVAKLRKVRAEADAMRTRTERVGDTVIVTIGPVDLRGLILGAPVLRREAAMETLAK